MKINVSKDLIKHNIQKGDAVLSNGNLLLIVEKAKIGYCFVNLNTGDIYSDYHSTPEQLVKSVTCSLICKGNNLEVNLIEQEAK